MFSFFLHSQTLRDHIEGGGIAQENKQNLGPFPLTLD
jgi:hypothetical protein